MAFAEIGDLVKAALGPLPLLCQEQVLLDLERARMANEDTIAADRNMKRDKEAKDQANRRVNQVIQNMDYAVFMEGERNEDQVVMTEAYCQLDRVRLDLQGHPWDPFPMPWTTGPPLQ